MSFKGKATTSGSNLSNKTYFWVSQQLGAGLQEWIYVTADTVATVDGSNYITEQRFIDVLQTGDRIWVYQVGSIDDTRDILADIAAGVTDYSLHLVLENTGTVVDLSDDLLSATPTYGD